MTHPDSREATDLKHPERREPLFHLAWNPQLTDYSEDYVRARFKHVDANGRYKDADLTAARPGGDTSYQWRVKRVADGTWTHDLEDEWESPHEGTKYRAVRPSSGRYWAYSRANMTAFAKVT